MGVPKFYRWTSERYPCLSEVINESQIPEFDNLYLDMNGIIHNCSHPNDDDVTFRITEEEIFVNIFAYIENLYNLIRPQKVFFMAVDGVAPRAKMNQQRARRFMSARTAQQQLSKALEKGEVIPTEKRFDSNCITPGTYFMTRLHNKLDDWIKKKSASDSTWQGRQIILSGHNVPGEGEHKIMDFIRSERSKSDYDPNTRHCMYGLDADLIMLGIVSHEPHFSLLREEVTFNTRPRKNEKAKKPQRTDSETKKFHLLHLSLLREYLAWEFASIKDSLPFAYDMERIVDDWILMGLLVGNDFLPHLPNIHIHDDALPLLYSTYRKVLPTLDGYINESGYLNLARFEKFLAQLALNDKNCFMEKMEDEQFMESKRIRPDPEENEEALVAFESSDIEDEMDDEENIQEEVEKGEPAFVSDHEEEEEENSNENDSDGISSQLDALRLEEEFNDDLATLALSGMNDEDFANNVEACWTKTIDNQFKRHKKSYYSEKLRYKNISKTELRGQAEGYVKAIQWNLHYYYHGCVSWSWFYPHHYAPFISDVQGFVGLKIEFELSKPFQPFEQLLAVLPEASSDCLPAPLRELMSSDPAQSSISDFYPAKFETDLNGKRNEWEAVVLIPFIEEKRLLEAIETKKNRLTNEENARNTHGCHIQCVSTLQSNAEWRSIRTELSKDLFIIPKEEVKWGLLPNVKMDVYFPGFPTMKHLSHTGQLRFANCNVFGMASRKESMVLKVQNVEKDIIEWGSELCDEEVCIDWPILKLAKVESIWGGQDRIVRKSPDDEIIVKEMTEEEKRQWAAHANQLSEHMMSRYAIEVEALKGSNGKHIRPPIVWVRKFTGLVYETQAISEKEPAMLKAIKQWSSPQSLIPVLLPLVVKDVLLENSRLLADLPLSQAYPENSIVWLTDPKSALFGMPAMVSKQQKKVSTKPDIPGYLTVVGMASYNRVDKMEVLRNKREQKSLRWMGGYDCARQCQVDTRLFARMTGTVFLWNEPKDKVEKGQQISSDSKINCGLALKFSKRDICLADYTDRIDQTNMKGQTNKVWIYTSLTCRLVTEYKKNFPEVWKHLETSNVMDDVYYAEDIWPDKSKRDQRFNQLKDFLNNLPSLEAENLKCGTEYADRQLISEIERIVIEKVEAKPTMKSIDVKSSGVFRYDLYDGKVHVDPEADFQILDRVALMSNHARVSKVINGTVVGIHGEKIDVLFDVSFDGGSKVRGSTISGAIRVPQSALFNITFGLIRKKVQQKKQTDAIFEGAYVPLQPKKRNHQQDSEPSTSTASNFNSKSQKSNKQSKNQKNQKPEKWQKPEKLEKWTLKKPDEKSPEELTDSLNKLLNIKKKQEPAPKTSEVTATASSSHPAGKQVSLMELLGGGGAKKSIPQKKKEEDGKPSVLDQLQQAQKENNSKKEKKSKNQNSNKEKASTSTDHSNKSKNSRESQDPLTFVLVGSGSDSAECVAPRVNTDKVTPVYPIPCSSSQPAQVVGGQLSVNTSGGIPKGASFGNQHINNFSKRTNPTLTDFKPSTVTRPNRTSNQPHQKITIKSKPTTMEAPVKSPEEPKSSEAATSSSSASKSKKPRKPKQSRLGVTFSNPSPSST